MSNKIRYCLLCQRIDRRTRRQNYTRICTTEREEKLREGYRRRYRGQELNQPLFNQLVHRKCYDKTVQFIPLIEQTNAVDDVAMSNEQNDDDDEENDQKSIIRSSSRAVLTINPKSVLERSRRRCIVCHSYAYSYTNRIKQVVSNVMAKKLAEGFLHRYKRPYGKSLLDAYIHDSCYRKLYTSYRYQPSRRLINRNRYLYQQQMNSQWNISPHKTRSVSNLNQSEDEPANASIEDLLSKPFPVSLSTTNPNIELSARSCLFRPCIQRLAPDEVEFYTKRNVTSKEVGEDNSLISDQSPTPVIQPLTTNDSMIDTIQNHDIVKNEEDLSPLHSTFIPPPKISTTAEIRYRSSKPTHSRPINPTHIPNIRSGKFLHHLDKLYDWLIEQLKSSKYPLCMSEVLAKYNEFTANEINMTKRERICRLRLRNRLEKFYPNEFIFVVPNKHDGTFIALNDIDYYVRSAIKTAHEEKEKSTKTSMVSSILVPPTPTDYQRETCETIMAGIRQIRLYIRDSKQINCNPSLLMQNLVGLITTSEKQFEKISHDYDFYRMIDENLFDSDEQKVSKKLDKNIRNMSLASDLISARHDHQISQKHYLLAEELAKETFHCTPRQVITLLNRYGHTCSYRSYQRVKAGIQRTATELDERQSSDIEIDLMEL